MSKIKETKAVSFQQYLDNIKSKTGKAPCEVRIFCHLTTPTDFSYRIVEIWDSKEGFEEFLEKRLGPASKAIALNRKTAISITHPLNFFPPRLEELPGLISSLPLAPKPIARTGWPRAGLVPSKRSVYETDCLQCKRPVSHG